MNKVMIKVSVSRALFLATALGLSGCANIPFTKPSSGVDTVKKAVEAPVEQVQPVVEEVIDPNLPKLELNASTLELLLTQHFASYNGDWPLATSSALKAAEETQDYRIARTATLLAFRADDYDKALEGARLWSQLQPDESAVFEVMLISLIGSGNIDLAVEQFDQKRDDKSIDDHIRYVASQVVRQRNAQAAMDVMTHYTQTYSDSAQVMLSSAQTAQVFEKFDQAEGWLDQAMQLQPGWELAAHMKAEILVRTGKTEEQAAFVEQYAKAHPESVVMNINHATNLAREERYQEAFDLMQGVLEKQPKDNADANALKFTAALAQQLKNNDLAKRYYNQVLAQDSTDDDARWSLGRLALIEEKYVTAEQLFSSIQAQESYVRAQIQVANARFHSKGLKSALDTLELLEPATQADYVDVALARHRFLLIEHKHEEAFGYINEVLLYLPNDLDIIYARALVAAELKKVDIAEADFRTIIAQQPDNADALNALGYTLADQTERYEEARILIEKALETRPDASHILDSMGWVLYRLNDYPKAITFLEKAYAGLKEVEIGAHLGEVYWESGDQEKAKTIWRESFEKDSVSPVLNETLLKYGVTFSVDEKDTPK